MAKEIVDAKVNVYRGGKAGNPYKKEEVKSERRAVKEVTRKGKIGRKRRS